MEETLLPETVTAEATDKVCIGCGSTEVLHGYPNALCVECRQHYINYPIPLWIKIFGGVIAALVIFSGINVTKNLRTGITLERGIKAENERRYLTAQREFEKVVSRFPQNPEANAHLLIASFYNHDFATFANTSKVLEGKTFDDQELFQKADYVFSSAFKYFPSDSLRALTDGYAEVKGGVPDTAIEHFVEKHSTDANSALQYASILLDKKEFSKVDTILIKLLKDDPEYSSALILLSASKRYQHNASEALIYIDKLLELNKEDVYALSSKARVMLMLRKDKEALDNALQAKRLAETDPFNTATLAITYHYIHNIIERDKIVAFAKQSKDSAITSYFTYAIDVINNKEKLRD